MVVVGGVGDVSSPAPPRRFERREDGPGALCTLGIPRGWGLLAPPQSGRSSEHGASRVGYSSADRAAASGGGGFEVMMKLPVGTVKSRLFRARRQLQSALFDHAVEMGYLKPARARS